MAVTDSAATSLESALATRTFDDTCEATTEIVDRQLGVNPATAPIDASRNMTALSRFISAEARKNMKFRILWLVRGGWVCLTHVVPSPEPLD